MVRLSGGPCCWFFRNCASPAIPQAPLPARRAPPIVCPRDALPPGQPPSRPPSSIHFSRSTQRGQNHRSFHRVRFRAACLPVSASNLLTSAMPAAMIAETGLQDCVETYSVKLFRRLICTNGAVLSRQKNFARVALSRQPPRFPNRPQAGEPARANPSHTAGPCLVCSIYLAPAIPRRPRPGTGAGSARHILTPAAPPPAPGGTPPRPPHGSPAPAPRPGQGSAPKPAVRYIRPPSHNFMAPLLAFMFCGRRQLGF